jgi:hypothetical protein
MHQWKNDNIKSQYELQKMVAKNNGVYHFSEEELAQTNLKSKQFTSIHDPQIQRLLELAYILGTLNGIQIADTQAASSPSPVLKQTNTVQKVVVQVPVSEEKLFFVACRVRNKQDKTHYATLTLKANNEKEAESRAATEYAIKNQTLIQCRILRSYATDTMQFQFGIGMKEMNELTELGRKYLK